MTYDTGCQVFVLFVLRTLIPSSHIIEGGEGKVCTIRSFTVPEYDRPTVGRMYFGTHILQLQPFSWADIIALLWIADQPAVVHPSLDLAILILPLSLLLLCLLGLPAQLHH